MFRLPNSQQVKIKVEEQEVEEQEDTVPVVFLEYCDVQTGSVCVRVCPDPCNYSSSIYSLYSIVFCARRSPASSSQPFVSLLHRHCSSL